MKCPYCNEELERDGDVLQCPDIDCRHLHNLYGSYELWQALIKTKQALEQSEICCTEWEKQALDCKAENIALSGELEHTRKALDVVLAELQEIDSCCEDNKYADNVYVGLDGHDTRNIALDVKKIITQIKQTTGTRE